VYAPSVQLTFSHPILRGFGASVARADRRRAAARRDIAGLLRDATAATLVRDVVRTYADVAAASDELEIRRSSADAARDQLKRAQADIEVGKQPPSASAEIEVAIARREEAVLLAEQTMVERSLELERLTGQPFERETTTLVASDALIEPGEAPSLDDAVAAALDRNPLARAAEARARATSIETDVASSSLLPQLDVVLAGGPAGSSPDLRTAYSTMAEFRGYAVSAGLVFQEPIGRHAARGARDVARAGTERAAMEETDVRRQIATAVVRGVVAVHTAGRRAAVLSRSTQSAELDLAAERARFESGRSTNFDVLRRQDQLALAKLGALAARLDYAKSLADVESLTGAILDRYGVKVP
jgi:outer membrane protein TolC